MSDETRSFSEFKCERDGHPDAGDGCCHCGAVVYYESTDPAPVTTEGDQP